METLVNAWLKNSKVVQAGFKGAGMVAKDPSVYSEEQPSWFVLEENFDLLDATLPHCAWKTPSSILLLAAVLRFMVVLRNQHAMQHVQLASAVLKRAGSKNQIDEAAERCKVCQSQLLQYQASALRAVAQTVSLILHRLLVRLRRIARRGQVSRSEIVKKLLHHIKFREGSRGESRSLTRDSLHTPPAKTAPALDVDCVLPEGAFCARRNLQFRI